jgi:hypothetical protein
MDGTIRWWFSCECGFLLEFQSMNEAGSFMRECEKHIIEHHELSSDTVKCICQIWDDEGPELQIPPNNPKCKCTVHGCNYEDERQAACCGHNCGLD